jgi:hypothetical protein
VDDVTLTQRVCELLAAATSWAWRSAGPAYTSSEVGLFYGALGAVPDRAVAVAVYGTDDDVATGLGTRRVQVRYRGAKNTPAGADALAELGFTALHDTYPGGGIARIARVSSARLGADENGRQERTDNYQVILDNPEATL